jgi:ribonuclease P protein component
MRREQRLRANADFQRVRHRGRSWSHRLLVLATLPNGLSHSRFGFSVGKRIGKAATRNQTKRRMREAVRLRAQRGEIAAGWDIVLIARRPAREASFHQVDEAIGLLLRRAGLKIAS